MSYTKVSKVTEIRVKNLTVDVHIPGFRLEMLKGKKIPKRRMKTRPSPEQKLAVALIIPETPLEIL